MARRVAEVDGLVVKGAKRAERLGVAGVHSDDACCLHRVDHGVDEGSELIAATYPAALSNDVG